MCIVSGDVWKWQMSHKHLKGRLWHGQHCPDHHDIETASVYVILLCQVCARLCVSRVPASSGLRCHFCVASHPYSCKLCFPFWDSIINSTSSSGKFDWMVRLLKYSRESFFGRNLASTKSMEAENTMWFSQSLEGTRRNKAGTNQSARPSQSQKQG